MRPELPTAVQGLVVEGTGACHVPSEYHRALQQMVDGGTPVVLASRANDKPRPARADRWLYACDLTAEKAALALMVGLHAEGGLDDWWDRLMIPAVFVSPVGR